MPKKLIKVPNNPLTNKRKWKRATEGKLKLYPRFVRRGLFHPDSEAAWSIEQSFEEMAWEHIRDMRRDIDY